MVLFNYATKELTAKVVYYGPGLCGKTTNLQFIYDTLPTQSKGKMLSLATKTDRTLFFDFLPIDLGTIRGMKTRIQLYTVPGQVFYDTTRKLVLKGADGVVFVADSQAAMLDANIDSFENLITNLAEQNLDIKNMPHVLQYNKRDMKNILSAAELEAKINRFNVPSFEAVAPNGAGVFETLKGISKLVLKHLGQKYGLEEEKPGGSSLSGRPIAPKPKLPNLPPKPKPASETPTVPDVGREEYKPEPVVAEIPRQQAPTTAPRVERQPVKAPEPVVAKKVAPLPAMEEEIEFIEDDTIGRIKSMDDLSAEDDFDDDDFDDEDLDFDVDVEDDEEELAEEPPRQANLKPIPSLDNSEVIELDDGDPLDVAELDDMAEIASMASASGDVAMAAAPQPDAIEVPVSINLPRALAGQPLRLQIDIVFSD